jgi:hypothetical protein
MPASTEKNFWGFKLALLAVAAFAANSFGALPEMKITTSDTPQSKNGGSCSGGNNGGWNNPWGGGGITSQTYFFPYVAVTQFQITDPNNSRNNVTRTSKPDSLRLRGNSTSGAAKKPYRLKFGDKVPLFGKEPAKSWVLLANFYDGTFALNAMAFELGKRLGLDFTPNYQFVDLYINNNYMGIYQLTEQIQSNPGRVDLKEKKRGWLAEFDYHSPASDECLSWFTTGSGKYNLTTFIKSPELDDTSFTMIPNDSTSLRFVKTDLTRLVDSMATNNFPNNGYRDLIDLESFAKYVLIQLVMDNFDFNSKTQTGYLPGSNYAYKLDSNRTTKIQAGPLWDFDLSAGVTTNGFPRHYQTYQDPIIPRHEFYGRLWQDDVFKAKYKKVWLKYKSDFQAMSGLIDNIKSQVSGSVTKSPGNAWANNQMMSFGTSYLTAQQFDTEVNNLKTWWTNRLNWVDGQLASIDTSKDIKPPTASVAFGFGKSGNSLSVVKNGLKINATGSVSVKVFTLAGETVRRQSFTAGSHAVSMGNLPRGMYLARVNIDGVKHTVRVPVR